MDTNSSSNGPSAARRRFRGWRSLQPAAGPCPRGGVGLKAGQVHGESDKTASSPQVDPVHPTELLATIYHAFGIPPETIVYNHLNQPRELVKASAVTGLFS